MGPTSGTLPDPADLADRSPGLGTHGSGAGAGAGDVGAASAVPPVRCDTCHPHDRAVHDREAPVAVGRIAVAAAGHKRRRECSDAAVGADALDVDVVTVAADDSKARSDRQTDVIARQLQTGVTGATGATDSGEASGAREDQFCAAPCCVLGLGAPS